MNWRSFDKPAHTTFDDKALHDGGLKDALGNVARGDSIPVAVVKAIFVKGGNVNHENVSAAQAVATGIGAIIHMFAPQYDAQVITIVGAIFALLGVIKPFLPPKVQGAL